MTSSLDLRMLITRAGITQREAARLLRVNPSTVRRWLADPSCRSYREAPYAAIELLRRMLMP